MAAERKTPNSLKFAFGGAAGMMATCIVHPLDVVKTRMQMSGAGSGKKEFTGTGDAIKKIVGNEGFFALYQGIGAGLVRQATYTTTRLGIYTYLNDLYKTTYQAPPTVAASLVCGLVAGAVGAYVGTPAEVALIRMAADGRLPPAERRNYGNVANAFMRIAKEEGITALWKGSMATVVRAVVVNMSQLSSYTQFKSMLKNKMSMHDGLGLHFCASMMAGLLTTITSMPLDIVKTRIQNQKTKEISGILDGLIKVVQKEGPLALWKGFVPYYFRIGPHTVFTLIFLEQLYKMYFFLIGESGKTSGL